jgi:hypothetical protein
MGAMSCSQDRPLLTVADPGDRKHVGKLQGLSRRCLESSCELNAADQHRSTQAVAQA